LGMNIQQIVSVASEGKLLDQSDSSNELREYLSQVDREYLEAYFNDFLASQLGGQAEVVIKYDFEGPSGEKLYGSIRVDIVTEDKVVEGGLDKRRSLDSLQQAIFASTLTNKHPAVAIYDTDGAWDNIEYRVLTAAKHLCVAFYWVKLNEIQRLN